MKQLVAGLVIFVLSHLIPSFPDLRRKLIDTAGTTGYRIVFSLVSVASLVLIVWGLKTADTIPLYEPYPWGRNAAFILTYIALYLFFSNPLGPAPSSAKALTAHPLNFGVICWATGHLLANGDFAHVLLFATFLGFSVVSIITGNARGQRPALDRRPPFGSEFVFLIVLLTIYAALVWGHRYFTGMPLI